MVEMDTLAHPRLRSRHKKSPVCAGEIEGTYAAPRSGLRTADRAARKRRVLQKQFPRPGDRH